MDETAQGELQERLQQLAVRVEQLSGEREHYRQLYLAMLERCERLERGIIAERRAERHTPDDPQMSLRMLEMMLGEAAAPVEPPPPEPSPEEAPRAREPERERRRPVRRPLPPHLTRVEVEILPIDVELEGLDAFIRIGEEVSEVLERLPASLFVTRIVRPKFIRKAADPTALSTVVLIAEPPERPIERGLAGPGLLADTVVRRWQDHSPLNRQESIYAREGAELSRSTICGWHEQLADLAEPVVDAMMKDALTQPYLCTDATGVLVRAEGQYQRAHFWVLVAPGRHVLYRHSERHDSAAVDRLLGGYKGRLVADAHSVYDHLYATGDVVEVGCWAHARRYFYKALGSEPQLADVALAQIGALFKIERKLKDAPRKEREKVRDHESRKLVKAFFDWCDQQAATVLEDTPLARALGYARNQRAALSRFLDDGRLPLDNNVSERNLRREVLGRKNWLFLGSDEGARVNTIFVSLLASCQLHGIEPWAYLRDLFCLLPAWPQTRALELAPAFWKQTAEQQDTQKRLAANVFRHATLAAHTHGV